MTNASCVLLMVCDRRNLGLLDSIKDVSWRHHQIEINGDNNGQRLQAWDEWANDIEHKRLQWNAAPDTNDTTNVRSTFEPYRLYKSLRNRLCAIIFTNPIIFGAELDELKV